MAAPMLHGITVLDFSRVLSAPYATMHLADMGADVIKVESPNVGDETRYIPPLIDDELSYYYLTLNRNKRDITLNLKTTEGLELAHQLVQQADVIVSNFRPGVMARLGLDYETCQRINPRVIYAVISGYGTTGTYSQYAGYDICAQAMSGLMSVTGYPDGTPTRSGVFIADHLAGLNLEIGILAALFEREHTGKGQYLEVALTDAALSVTLPACSRYFPDGNIPLRTGNDDPGVAPSAVFSAADGDFVLSCGNQNLWEKLCRKVLNMPDLIDNPDYADNYGRLARKDELRAIIEGWIGRRSRDECVQLCNDAGLPCAPIWNLAEAYNGDFYRNERNIFLNMPIAGTEDTVDVIAQPIVFADHPRQPPRPAPRLGQDTEALLREKLGINKETYQSYKTNGIV